MSTITKDLGVVTAYGYYKAGGGTMTESEFTQFMVDFGTASKTATEAAQAALESENAARASEETATQKSTEAGESATTASSKAEEAAQSASEANAAKDDAVAAKTAAETAQGKAEDAQAAAESFAESIPSDYSQLSEDVSDLKEEINNIAESQSVEIDDNTLSSDNYIYTNGTLSANTSFHHSDMIQIESWMKTVTITSSGSLSSGCAVAFYTANTFNTTTFISGVSLPSEVTSESPVITEIPSNAVYMAFSSRKSVPFNATIDGDGHLIFDDTFTSTTRPASAKAIMDKLSASLSMPSWAWQCDVGKPVIHFSFDDFCRAFIDIINGSYSSIWDQPLFADLKSLHESTGAVFTLNCFNTFTENSSYSISNLPSTYATELSSAKSWLKFAFHGENDESNYNTSTGILTSYNTFVNAIYTFTGDYDCIDRITRLGFFGGTLENVLAIKNASHGIMGLLSADDTRTSYYLSQATSNYLYQKGKYYDQNNDLIFVKSQPRADSNNATAIDNGLLSNPTNMKLTEIYMHEQTWDVNYKNRIRDIATWANNNGYVHAYPSLIYSH